MVIWISMSRTRRCWAPYPSRQKLKLKIKLKNIDHKQADNQRLLLRAVLLSLVVLN